MSSAAKHYLTKLREADKILHMQYSAGILFFLALVLPLPLALVLTFVIGLGKECWDHYYGSGFCYYDMLANVIGMAAILPIVFLLKASLPLFIG